MPLAREAAAYRIPADLPSLAGDRLVQRSCQDREGSARSEPVLDRAGRAGEVRASCARAEEPDEMPARKRRHRQRNMRSLDMKWITSTRWWSGSTCTVAREPASSPSAWKTWKADTDTVDGHTDRLRVRRGRCVKCSRCSGRVWQRPDQRPRPLEQRQSAADLRG